MTIRQLANHAVDKSKFTNLQGYIDFCQRFLEFIATEGSIQATIVAQNEHRYQFWQYNKAGNYQISRPINSELLLTVDHFGSVSTGFSALVRNLATQSIDAEARHSLNHTVYTIQQSIGAALDALPAGQSNKARKLNGTLFEQLIRLILVEMGIDAKAGVVKVPVVVDGNEQFKMSYQHDLIISSQDDVKAIGSIKTSSKDRIDKIFIDKFLYSRLTESELPHIAIFLNDVQRKGDHPKYGIGSTFLPGHFKGYTVKLNPLDGVYYCDIRPAMQTDLMLKKHIKTLDHLLCTDIWTFLKQDDGLNVTSQ